MKKTVFKKMTALLIMLLLSVAFIACEDDSSSDKSEATDVTDSIADGGTLSGTYASGKVVEVAENATVSLVGKVIFETGSILRIGKGATVKADTSALSVLIISQGAKIYAEGTAEAPITFTRLDSSNTWGGIVINGYAQTNKGEVENGEADSGRYGSASDSQNDDDSGVLKYVRVFFAGWNFTEDDQLNGICLQGVGSKTVIDYVQIHRGADDGIEMFGGTVNISHIISSGNEDDQIDCTDGWKGTIEYAVAISLNEKGNDKAIEHDNNSKDNIAIPKTVVNYKYLTLIAGRTDGDGKKVGGARIREGAEVNFENSYFFGLTTSDTAKLVDVRDATSKSVIKNSTFQNGSAGNVAIGISTQDGASATTEGSNLTNGADLLEANFASYAALKAAGAAAFVTTGNGAITDAANNWAAGWTEFPTE